MYLHTLPPLCCVGAMATSLSPLGSHGTPSAVERTLKEDNACLRKKLKELEENHEQEILELMTKCAVAEEGRRRAEDENRQCAHRLAEAEASHQQLQGVCDLWELASINHADWACLLYRRLSLHCATLQLPVNMSESEH